ncbi:hypothetical protein RCL1_001570 [Eukaryota sp. TZLM3-RCL]
MATAVRFPERDNESPIPCLFSPSPHHFRSITPVRFAPPHFPTLFEEPVTGHFSSVSANVYVTSGAIGSDVVGICHKEQIGNVFILTTTPLTASKILSHWFDVGIVSIGGFSLLELLRLFFNTNLDESISFPFRLSFIDGKLSIHASHKVIDVRSSLLFRAVDDPIAKQQLETIFASKNVPLHLCEMVFAVACVLQSLFHSSNAVDSLCSVIQTILGSSVSSVVASQLVSHIRSVSNILETTELNAHEHFLVALTYNIFYILAHHVIEVTFPRDKFVFPSNAAPFYLNYEVTTQREDWEFALLKTCIANLSLRSLEPQFQGHPHYEELVSLHQHRYKQLSRIGRVSPHDSTQLKRLDASVCSNIQVFNLFQHSVIRNRVFSFTHSFLATLIPSETIKHYSSLLLPSHDSHYYSSVIDDLNSSDFLIYVTKPNSCSLEAARDCSISVIHGLENLLPISCLFCPALNQTVEKYKEMTARNESVKSPVPITPSRLESALSAMKASKSPLLSSLPRLSSSKLPQAKPVVPPRTTPTPTLPPDSELDMEICGHQPAVPNFHLRRVSCFNPEQVSMFRHYKKEEVREKLHKRLQSFVDNPDSLLGKEWFPAGSQSSNILSTSLPNVPLFPSTPRHARFASLPSSTMTDTLQNDLEVTAFAETLPNLFKSIISKHDLYPLITTLIPNLLHSQIKSQQLQYFAKYLPTHKLNLLIALAMNGFKLPCPDANIFIKNCDKNLLIDLLQFMKTDFNLLSRFPSTSHDRVVLSAVGGISEILLASDHRNSKVLTQLVDFLPYFSSNSINCVAHLVSSLCVEYKFGVLPDFNILSPEPYLQSISQTNLSAYTAFILNLFNSTSKLLDPAILVKSNSAFFNNWCTALQSLATLYSKLVIIDTPNQILSDIMTIIISMVKSFGSVVSRIRKGTITSCDSIILKKMIVSLFATRYDVLLPCVVYLMTCFAPHFRVELIDESLFKIVVQSIVYCYENFHHYCTNLVTLISNLHCTFRLGKSPLSLCIECGLSKALVLSLLQAKRSLLPKVLQSLLAFSGLKASRSFKSLVSLLFQEMFAHLKHLNIGPLFDLLSSSSVFLSGQKLDELSTSFSDLISQNPSVVEKIIATLSGCIFSGSV